MIEGHDRRPQQKATPEGHTRRPHQKSTPEGHNRRANQKAITDGKAIDFTSPRTSSGQASRPYETVPIGSISMVIPEGHYPSTPHPIACLDTPL